MKKYFSLLITLILVFSFIFPLSACGEKEPATNQDNVITSANGNETNETEEEDISADETGSGAATTNETSEPAPIDYTKFTATDLELTSNGNQLDIHNNFGDASTQYAWYVLEGDTSNRIEMQWYTESPDFSYTFEDENSTYFIRAFIRDSNDEEIKKDVFIYDITFEDGALNYDVTDYRAFTISDIEYKVNGKDISVTNNFGDKHTVYAWYVYEGSTDNKIETIWYTDDPHLTYTVSNTDSVYYVRCFCRDANENTLAYSVVTDEIKLS